jgi:hypothetical protein
MADEPVLFRQGEIITYNYVTGANTVKVLGTILANLPIMTTGEVTSLKAGDVVGILKVGVQYFILGRIDSSAESLSISAGSAGRGLLDFATSATALPAGGTTSAVHATTNLSLSVTPDSNRLLRISLYTSVISTVAADRVAIAIRDVTQRDLGEGYAGPLTIPTAASYDPANGYVYIQERGATVSAGPRATICPIVAYDDRGLSGARTYQVSIQRVSGTGTCKIDADAVGASWLMVEDVGPLV